MKRFAALVPLLALMAAPALCAPQADLAPTFPFSMPVFDASPTAVDMSFLNAEPAGARGFVRVRDGHFVDGAGRRLRLLGTNFTFAGAFPPKDAAPRVAARLRKLGMNVVRFHHMDNQVAPRGIWKADRKEFDPEQLDRLDWMIFQLKQHGIYSNINLHVSRNYPGLPTVVERQFNYGKALDNFHRPYIDLQRDYARALLTHVNPYTGKSYAEEPAIVTVEINNENTLLGTAWGALRAMPEPFLGDLTAQWQKWLRARYQTTAGLRKAWDEGSEPLGAELLANGAFTDGAKGWSLELAGGEGTMAPVAEGPAGQPAVFIDTKKAGDVAWSFQLLYTGLTLTDGVPYTLTFQARADSPRDIGADIRLDQAPWTGCGFNDTVHLTKEWQKFSFTFKSRDTIPGHARVTLGLRNQVGQFWVAGVSLRRGGVLGLPPEQTLEAGNIPLPPGNVTPAQQSDFFAFLAETERAYVAEMVAFLKKDVKVQAPVIDTQASYGGIGGTYREAALCDFVDMHAYWQHPSFPGRPWDGDNWFIGNRPMVREPNGGTLFSLAMHRVAGKPFTVSEYDHPAPSFYSAEMFPMFASFAAFQDWDGLYQFDYGDTAGDEARLTGYFSMRAHPAKVAFLPIAALLFRGEAVKPGGAPAVLEMPEGQVVPQLVAHGNSVWRVWQAAGADPALPLRRPVAVRFTKSAGAPRVAGGEAKGTAGRTSATGEIAWAAEPAEQALYTVNTPRVRVATGYLGGRSITVGDVTFTMESTPSNWGSVALASLDGEPVARSKRLLLVAMGRAENTDMGWNEQRTSVGRKWGQAPIRAEGIPLRVALPGAVKTCQALDGTGKETQAVPVDAGTVAVGPQQGTVWYLITR